MKYLTDRFVNYYNCQFAVFCFYSWFQNGLQSETVFQPLQYLERTALYTNNVISDSKLFTCNTIYSNFLAFADNPKGSPHPRDEFFVFE